jgi:hypothetical protein
MASKPHERKTTMRHRVASGLALLAVLALAAVPAPAADDAGPALGTWDMVAATPQGDMPAVLTLTEADGALKADLELHGSKRSVSDPKFAEGVLTLRVLYEGTYYDVKARIDGEKMDGTWAGGGESGTLKAKRRP